MRDKMRHSSSVHMYKQSMVLPRKINDVFPFFADAGNLERITPPELCFRIISPTPVTMGEGVVIDYSLKLFGVPFAWRARICRWQPPLQFIDEQIQGPYRVWVHKHRFIDLKGSTRVTDEVTYALPLWPLGEAAFPLVRYLMMRIFRFRERAIRAILHEVR